LRAEIVDRDADVVEPKLPCDTLHSSKLRTTSVPLISMVSPSNTGSSGFADKESSPIPNLEERRLAG
jgi:hypothetical protein